MGYTHYWEQSKPFTEKQWTRIMDGAKYVIEAAGNDRIKLADGLANSGSKPEVSKDKIWLNGAEDDDYETFCLEREGSGFSFCKTAYRPYDAVVVSILALARAVAPGAISLDSDGGPEVFENTPY